MTRAGPGESRPYQRGSKLKNGDGRWVVVVRDAGKRPKPLYGSTRAEVIERRDEWNAAMRMGLTPPSGRLTVGHHLVDWLEDRRAKIRPSTWASYELHVRLHLGSLHRIQLVKLTPADVRRLVRERTAAGCAPRTVAYSLSVLRMALGQAVADGLVPRNVGKLAAAPRRARSELVMFAPAQASRFLAAAAGDDLYGLWAVLIGTGMRLGEALALRRSDIDLVAGRVTVAGSVSVVRRICRKPGDHRLIVDAPKTDAGWRTIALPAFATAAIRTHLERDAKPRNIRGTVFTSARGTLLDGRNVSVRFHALLGSTDLPRIRIHDLRHTAASLMLAQGFTLFDVQKTLGHASIQQTANTYGHLVSERSHAIAAGMDALLTGSGRA